MVHEELHILIREWHHSCQLSLALINWCRRSVDQICFHGQFWVAFFLRFPMKVEELSVRKVKTPLSAEKINTGSTINNDFRFFRALRWFSNFRFNDIFGNFNRRFFRFFQHFLPIVTRWSFLFSLEVNTGSYAMWLGLAEKLCNDKLWYSNINRFCNLTGSEILSKILIRCATWHWACDCSFRCFHEIGRGKRKSD